MKTLIRTRKFWLPIGGLLLVLSMLGMALAPKPESDDAKAVLEAWQQLRQAGSYEFHSRVEQTILPGPRLSNVGRAAERQTYYISGSTDLPAERMLISMYQNSGSLLNSGDGVDIRLEDGKAFGRAAGEDWRELEDFSAELFAPGNDAASFLSAAVNVQRIKPGQANLGAVEALVDADNISHYRFTLDPEKYAMFMREQMLHELKRSGKLPPGMNLGMSEEYRTMDGRGDVWLSPDGLPLRLTLALKFAPGANGDQVTAVLGTDFNNVDRGRLLAAQSFPARFANWVGLGGSSRHLAEKAASVQAGLTIALLALLLVTSARSKRLYQGVALAVILSMVITPLWEGAQAKSFTNEMNQRVQRQQQVRAESARQQADVQKYSTMQWNPQLNPMQQTEAAKQAAALRGAGALGAGAAAPSAGERLALSQAQLSQQNDPEISNVDTDQDGLADEYELDYVYTTTLGVRVQVLDPNNADTDGDGLSDGEELKLELQPINPDTDNDGIPDLLEVQSFYFGGKDWYSNPNDKDTDKDGRLDGAECYGRVASPSHTTIEACTDTDGDNIPDIFDTDDDNDGVPTSVDVSPYDASSTEYSGAAPYKFQVTNLTSDKPVFITYQVRPTNADHLSYALNVLDWPTGDTDGQYQRVKDSTFSNQMTSQQLDQDPRPGYGDMRLMPMLEVRLSGSNLPLPLTSSVSFPITATAFSGQISLFGKSSTPANDVDVKVDVSSSSVASFDIYQGDGDCNNIYNPTLVATFASGETHTYAKTLGALMEGGKVMVVRSGDDILACAAIPAVAHGSLPDQVVDAELLHAYGAAVRNDTNQDVLLYAPLSLVSDQTETMPSAFQTQVPFTSANNSFDGVTQSVRVVWLLNMLLDTCKPAPDGWDEAASGTWCSASFLERWDTDVNQVTQTYDDPFHLTGISVQEDLGMKMAVVFENPLNNADNDPEFDDRLWLLSHGLEGSFAAGRPNGAGDARDMTVEEIVHRFDAENNADISTGDQRLWNLPRDAFQAEFFSYPITSQGVARFTSEDLQSRILAPYYDSPQSLPTRSQFTLLFAREQEQRSVISGETSSVTCTAGVCSYDFSGQSVSTMATLNWAPYRKDGEAWKPYPLTEYLDHLESVLRSDAAFQPMDDSQDAAKMVDGQMWLARLYYESMYRGMSVLVAVNGAPVINIPALFEDSYIFTSFYALNAKAQGVTSVVKGLAGLLIEQWTKYGTLAWLSIGKGVPFGVRIQAVFLTIANAVSEKLGMLGAMLKYKVAKIAVGIAVGIIAVGLVACLFLFLLIPNTPAGRIAGRIFLVAVGLITAALAIKGIYDVYTAVKSASGALQASATASVIGAVVGVVILWGVFLYSWISSGSSAFSLQANAMAADAIAMTITLVLLAVLACDPTGVGPVIVAIIALVDAIINIFCAAFGVHELDPNDWRRQYICIGLTGWISKIIKWAIYSQTYMIDYENSNRLSFTGLQQTLEHNDLGMTVGNMMSVTIKVSNYITLSDIPIDWKAAAYWWQYSGSNAKSAAFNYLLSTEDTAMDGDLERNSLPAGTWQDVPNKSDVWEGKFDARTNNYSIAVPEPGINVDPTVIFNEGAAIPVQECIGIPVAIPFFFLIPVCWVRTSGNTINSPVGSSITVDSLPATLDDFYTLAPTTGGGYSFAWGRQQPLAFPTFKDADGDKLISQAFGGNDPDDGFFDVDNDGLSDYQEITLGLDPRLSDTDDDGLSDAEEVRLGTSPTRKDTDGDGLTDAKEVAGWLFTYGFYADGSPKETMVYPDPFMPDSDFDGLTDLMESIYGFNPRVPDSANVLDYQLDLMELDAPVIQLRFDEPEGAAAFIDRSGFGFNAICPGDPCPVAGMVGEFANAVRFGGADYLNLPGTTGAPRFDDGRPFTLAAWVQWQGGAGTILSKAADTSTSSQEVAFGLDGSGRLALDGAGGSITSSGGLSADVWTHVAVSFDGSQVAFYVNGAAAGSGSWSSSSLSGVRGPITLGAQMNAGAAQNYFNGMVDELNVFDRSLTRDEVVVRTLAARYNLNDSFVRPGEDIYYRSTVQNLLNSRFAYGLLTTLVNPRTAITNWETKLLPTTFVLWPDNPVVTGVNTKVISATLQIDPAISTSQGISITQTAAAQIVDRRYESNFAELWLKFNEAAGEGLLEDSAGNMPPRNVTCSGCVSGSPALGQGGILNSAIQFKQGGNTPLALGDLNTLRFLNRGYTAAMWVKPSPGSGAERITLLRAADGANVILQVELVRITDGSYFPHVTVNGVDVTASTSLWRLVLPNVWSHVVAQYDDVNDVMAIYINGARVVEIPSINAITTSAPLVLGGTTQGVDFWVDDLRLFSRAISSLDINRLAERPVLYLPMDSTVGDSSVYNQTTAGWANTPAFIGSSIRNQSYFPNQGASQSGIKVDGNALLNMHDGAFAFSVWIYPTSGNSAGWEGVFGYDSGPSPSGSSTVNTAYPSLQRLGSKLRFGYGDGSQWLVSPDSGNVLTVNQWSHLVTTLEPVTASGGATTYEYTLYVNGVKVQNYSFPTPPSTSTTFFVGRSTREWQSKVNYIYVSDFSDYGSQAEIRINAWENGGGKQCIWPGSSCNDGHDVDKNETYQVNQTRTYWSTDNIKYEVWEDDPFDCCDDFSGETTHHWYDTPSTYNVNMSNGFDGTFNVTMTRAGMQFYGAIDELEVYRYALDSEQVYDLYNAIPVTARLPLDERPAADTFENRAQIGQIDDGVCSGDGCPASGTVGLIDQAVRFDGLDDVITVPVDTTKDYMVSVWVNTFCDDCGLYTLTKSAVSLNELYLKNGNLCAFASGVEQCTAGGGFADENWHHLVYSNSGTQAKLWVDGTLVGTMAVGSPMPDAAGAQAWLGKAERAEQDYLNGQLDDVRVFRYSQGDQVVAQLLRRAPLFYAHLDEPKDAMQFSDATPIDWSMACTSGACPSAGEQGRLGTSVSFDGQNDILTLEQAQLDPSATSFSMGVWVMPLSEPLDHAQTLFALATPGGALKYSVVVNPGDNKLSVVDFYNPALAEFTSNVSLIQNVWNYVTLTVDRKGTVDEITLYINGYVDTKFNKNDSGSAMPAGLGKLYLGNWGGSGSALSGPFNGRLDEPTVYGSLLNEIDVRDTFHYQMAQVEERASRSLTIDAEAPTVELSSYNAAFPYLNGDIRRMAATATDASAGVSRVMMTVTQASAAAPWFQIAPACEDDLSGQAFCPLFDPGFDPAINDGLFNVKLQSLDNVGHVSPLQDYSLYVDKGGPRLVRSAAEPNLVSARKHATLKRTWYIPLMGSASDPELSDGSVGSGLDIPSLHITIYGPGGQIVGQGAQTPAYDPATQAYALDYLVPEKEPSGKLTVVVEAADRVGNIGTLRYDILLDASPSRGRLNPNAAPTPDLSRLMFKSAAAADASAVNVLPILGSSILSGTVSDEPPANLPYISEDGKQAASGVQKVQTALTPQINASYLFNEPYPEGLLAWMPLDKDQAPVDVSGEPISGTLKRLFLDISPAQIAGECEGAACPWGGLPGHFVGSVYFDGNLRQINLGQQIDLSERSFSVAVWASRDELGRNDTILWQGPVSAPERRILFGLNSDDQFVCGFGGSDLTTADPVTDTDWHFWACSFDAESGARAIYRDGELAAQDTSAPLPEQFENLYIGAGPVGSFKGHLDELKLFDHALDAADMRSLFVGYHPVYQLDVTGEWASDGDTLVDSSGFTQRSLLHSGDAFNKVMPGQVGLFGLKLSGSEYLSVTPDYSLAPDLGKLTLSAWISPTLGAPGDIISQRDDNPEYRYPSLTIDATGKLEFGFGNGYDFYSVSGPTISGNAWRFVAVSFDGIETTFYVDGVSYSGGSALAGKTPYPNRSFNVGQGFVGGLDDVRVTMRALSAAELELVMNTAWQDAALSGGAWTNPTPHGLEGSFNVDVRGVDNFGKYDTNPGMEKQWGGVVDTLAPRLSITQSLPLSQTLPITSSAVMVTYTFSVEDFLLDMDGIQVNMCSGPMLVEKTYYNSEWYLAQGTPPNSSLYRVTATCTGPVNVPLGATVYACDAAGNCASQSMAPFMAHAIFLPVVHSGDNVAAAKPADRPEKPGKPQPPEGGQVLKPAARNVGVDTVGPDVQVAAAALSLQDFRSPFFAVLRGQVADDYGVDRIEIRISQDGVELYRGSAAIIGEVWNAMWLFPDGKRPAGGVYQLEVIAYDLAGNASTVRQDLIVP